jgi:hypothetical protein
MSQKNSGFVGKNHLEKQVSNGMTINVILKELVCGNFKWSEMPQDRTRGFLLGW